MIPATAHANVETQLFGETKEFTMNVNGGVFKHLSSTIYTDKPAAILRELGANAYDAHIAADNVKRPFEVYLPNIISPTLRIVDYGTGLSHKDMMHLYSTYFDSSKTTSNDFTGGFGVGSKTPFSYVDAFTVISRFNGEKRTYAAFLSKDGTPTITLMNTTSTNEHNGLTVEVPIEEKDFHRFAGTAERVYKFFPVIPEVHGIDEITPPKYVIKGKKFAIQKFSVWNPSLTVVMGPVSYKLNRDSFTTEMLEKFEAFDRVEYVLFADIGQLNVTLSREALSYDKHTLSQLDILLDEMKSGYEAILNKKVGSCKTYWEARLLTSTLDIPQKMDVYWQGINVTTSKYGDYSAYKFGPDIQTFDLNRKFFFSKRPLVKWSHYRHLSLRENKLCIHLEKVTPGYAKTILYNKDILDRYDVTLVKGSEKEFQQFVADFDGVNWINFVELPTPPGKPKGTTTSACKTEVKIKRFPNNDPYEPAPIELSIEEINNGNYVWIEMNGHNFVRKGMRMEVMISLLENMRRLEVLNHVQLIGIPQAHKNKIKHITAENVIDYAKRILPAYTKSDKVKKWYYHDLLYNTNKLSEGIGNYFEHDSFRDVFNKHIEKYPESKLNIFENARKFRRKYHIPYGYNIWSSMKDVLKELGIKEPTFKRNLPPFRFARMVEQEYPLVHEFLMSVSNRSHQYNAHSYNFLLHYFELVEEKQNAR